MGMTGLEILGLVFVGLVLAHLMYTPGRPRTTEHADPDVDGADSDAGR